MVAQRVRSLCLLPLRLGNPLPGTEKLRLFGEWQLRAVCSGTRRLTAVSTMAFKQAIGMLRRGGTCVLNGLPPGEFPVSIFDLVLNGYTIRGSIVGTRLD